MAKHRSESCSDDVTRAVRTVTRRREFRSEHMREHVARTRPGLGGTELVWFLKAGFTFRSWADRDPLVKGVFSRFYRTLMI